MPRVGATAAALPANLAAMVGIFPQRASLLSVATLTANAFAQV